jgi:toxin FitB
MYLLDTNVVSELRRPKADPNVSAWARGQPSQILFLSVVSIEELEIGVVRVERKDARQGILLRGWFADQVLTAFAGRILPVDLDVVRVSATFHVPDQRPIRDAYIAATAQVHGLTVVTRNTADFDPTGVPAFNPWFQI